MTELLLFKTTVTEGEQLRRLTTVLNVAYAGRWNLDLWEDDRTLRFIGERKELPALKALLEELGVDCTEIEANISLPVTAGTPVSMPQKAQQLSVY